MNNASKNHTTSKIVARLAVRLFLILLFVSVAPFLVDSGASDRLEHTYLYVVNKWALIFPALLFLSFLGLLILTLKHKYSKVDLNWMLALNTALLIIYVVLLYVRVYPLLFK